MCKFSKNKYDFHFNKIILKHNTYMNMLKGKIQTFLYICIENYNFQIVILVFLFFLLDEFKY